MRAVLQRVSNAEVTVNQEIVGKIGNGLLILLGIEHEDAVSDIDYLVKKISQMRIFSDSHGKMNCSIMDVGGQCLVVSQFTLYASTKKGNRPSFIAAARPEVAIPLYERFVKELEVVTDNKVETGVFGAEMQINLVNQGPVTIIIDSKEK